MGRKTIGRRSDILWIALVAAALAVPAAIADEAGTSSLKKDVAKALKNSKTAKKKAKKALNVAEETSQQEGPTGPAGPPGADGLMTVEEATAADTVATDSATSVDLGGPSVQVTMETGGGWVLIGGRAEIDRGADPGTLCQAEVTSTTVDLNDAFILSGAATPFTQTQTGTLVSRFLPAGIHNLRVDYLRNGGTSTCQFRNRELTVAVIG